MYMMRLIRVFSTLSTRKRHVLHIAADGWELGGGHFERSVQFGYDADLSRVSAEFEGDCLILWVPRKDIRLAALEERRQAWMAGSL
jgi:hypothetical protein